VISGCTEYETASSCKYCNTTKYVLITVNSQKSCKLVSPSIAGCEDYNSDESCRSCNTNEKYQYNPVGGVCVANDPIEKCTSWKYNNKGLCIACETGYYVATDGKSCIAVKSTEIVKDCSTYYLGKGGVECIHCNGDLSPDDTYKNCIQYEASYQGDSTLCLVENGYFSDYYNKDTSKQHCITNKIIANSTSNSTSFQAMILSSALALIPSILLFQI